MQAVYQKLPCPLYGLFLEVVAERPVAEHLEHGVVIGVVPYLVEVVVLARHAQTFLCIGGTWGETFAVAEEYVFELVHPGVGEHERRVVLYHHRRRGHYLMVFLLEKIYETLSDQVAVHIFLLCFIRIKYTRRIAATVRLCGFVLMPPCRLTSKTIVKLIKKT